MPVYAEYIREPEPQDRSDLELLYPGDSERLINNAAKSKIHLVAGRFNGRLIAAMTLTPIHGGDYQVAQLTVRDITRRRGVARQLLIQCLKDLPDDLTSLCADLRTAPELSSLFNELGFTASGSTWQWQRPTRE
ncbi:PanM family protein [Spongiibacter sp. KMU-166]|uniref:PanM family protein n=1 Tax=Spongiibacter thalassae TaxID=2721624 RepID=A0ABX1GJ64_9GAMM|nr:acetyl-CoA sensor PanZ family protein [Spongiibacter thalassae]NKI19206.1 PanM family protein [Spongiibacter thalassae]